MFSVGKWGIANPYFKNCEYELPQMHRLKFKDMDEDLKNEIKKDEQEKEIAYRKMQNLRYLR
ncbi:MAG: hypothetical protein NC905_06765 [Candidatus Omnitrophica bacterium]|nr:hypothetical protein [Candidatus Omnitrophota bacterium]